MALSNAEKQAAYRARYAANKDRVAELEAEVARLKKASPAAIYQLGGNLQRLGEAYWGRDGKWGARKRMTFDQKTEAIKRRREGAKKRQAKMFSKGG